MSQSLGKALAGGFGGEVLEEIQLLPPLARETELTRAAVGEVVDGASVRFEITREDVDERGLTRTIVATQQHHFTLSKASIYTI